MIKGGRSCRGAWKGGIGAVRRLEALERCLDMRHWSGALRENVGEVLIAKVSERCVL